MLIYGKRAIKAMTESLDFNQVWDLVLAPDGKQSICYKWVYKMKKGVDGKGASL